MSVAETTSDRTTTDAEEIRDRRVTWDDHRTTTSPATTSTPSPSRVPSWLPRGPPHRRRQLGRLTDIAEHIAALEHDTTVDSLRRRAPARRHRAVPAHLPTMDDAGGNNSHEDRGLVEATALANSFDKSRRGANASVDDGADRRRRPSRHWPLGGPHIGRRAVVRSVSRAACATPIAVGGPHSADHREASQSRSS